MTSLHSNTEPKPSATHEDVVAAKAAAATSDEHDLSIRQACRLYARGILWSVIMSTALIMEGYDNKLVPSFFAQPAFQRTYGVQQHDDKYQVPAPWQAGLSNGSTLGGIIGLAMSGWLGERFGFRRVIMCGLATMVPLLFLQFLAPNLTVLLVGQVLLGTSSMPSRSCALN